MAKPPVVKQKTGRTPPDLVVAVKRSTGSPIDITYPLPGTTVKGKEFAASGKAPTSILSVVGTLARKDDPTRSVDGAPLTPPSPWSISFSKADVDCLFDTGEMELEVILTVKDASGTAKPQTCAFTIDRSQALRALSAMAITPDPPLCNTTVSCPFTSTGEAPPGPLYAFIARPGCNPIMGSLVQPPMNSNSDEFVFLWQNVPPGTGYAIYYQNYGNPTIYATDGNITVQ